MNSTLKITGLTKGNSYTTFRYESYVDYPTNGDYLYSNYSQAYNFLADNADFSFFDPLPIDSSRSVYYATIETPA